MISLRYQEDPSNAWWTPSPAVLPGCALETSISRSFRCHPICTDTGQNRQSVAETAALGRQRRIDRAQHVSHRSEAPSPVWSRWYGPYHSTAANSKTPFRICPAIFPPAREIWHRPSSSLFLFWQVFFLWLPCASAQASAGYTAQICRDRCQHGLLHLLVPLQHHWLHWAGTPESVALTILMPSSAHLRTTDTSELAVVWTELRYFYSYTSTFSFCYNLIKLYNNEWLKAIILFNGAI